MSVETNLIHEDERIGHECGIGLIYTYKPTNVQSNLLDLGHALQHRGQNGAGIVTSNPNSRIAGDGLIDQAFTRADLDTVNANTNWAIIHLRYGTSGGYSKRNLQPIEMQARNGDIFHVAVNGNMPLMEGVKRELGMAEELSDTYAAAHVLAQMASGDWDEAIQRFADLPEVAESANNMLVGVGNEAYVMRDKYGVHPLVVGDYHGLGLVFASETVGFQKIGVETVGEFARGAIMKMSPSGAQTLRAGQDGSGNACIFEPAYFSSPNSSFEHDGKHSPEDWMSVSRFRFRTGEIAAEESPVEGAHFVVGMPDSGIPFANGFAYGAGLPIQSAIIRSHYNGEGIRTFMQDEQMSNIARLVRGKLMPVTDPGIWKGAISVICDDSLVRGNNSREMTAMIRKLGVREIHWRLGFPPVNHPCHLGVSFRSHAELLASIHDGDLDAIAADIGADSIRYISPQGIIRASLETGHVIEPEDPNQIFLENGWCGGCTTGEFPVPRYEEGTIFRSRKNV